MDYRKLLNRFNKNFDAIYNAQANGSYMAGYDEALDYYDNVVRTNPILVNIRDEFNQVRKDILSSDRECVAFVFSLEDCGVLDRLGF